MASQIRESFYAIQPPRARQARTGRGPATLPKRVQRKRRRTATFLPLPGFLKRDTETHPGEYERPASFPGSAGEHPRRSVRSVTHAVAGGFRHVFPFPKRLQRGDMRVSRHPALASPASCYTVSRWLANASANISWVILRGANRSRARFASHRNPLRRHRHTTKIAVGLKSAPGTVK